MYSSNTRRYWMNIYMIFVQYIPCTVPIYVCIRPVHTYIDLNIDILALCIRHVWTNIVQYKGTKGQRDKRTKRNGKHRLFIHHHAALVGGAR